MAIQLNRELVAIHSHICGDGNMYIKIEKRSPSSIRCSRTDKPFIRYIIEYTNTCPELLDYMIRCIKKLFPEAYVYRSDKKHRIQFRSKELFDTIKKLGYPDGESWSVPDTVISNPKFRKIWLRSFFDDEGSVRQCELLCYNTNKEAMRTIRKMLTLEGFKTSWYSRIPRNKNYKICYTIRIAACSYLLFRNIGFNHPEKKKKFENYCKKRMRRPGRSE